MKIKIIQLFTVISSSLAFSPLMANDFTSQHRIGIGYNDTNIYDTISESSVSWGKGIKLEYGYEVSRIIGFNASYAKNKDSSALLKIDGNKFQLDTDIGYKFDLEGFTIKPYGVLGLAYLNEDNTYFTGNKYNYSDTSFVIGTGVRGEFGQYLYSDFRYEFSIYDDVEYDTLSLSVGYRF